MKLRGCISVPSGYGLPARFFAIAACAAGQPDLSGSMGVKLLQLQKFDGWFPDARGSRSYVAPRKNKLKWKETNV
ncbi:hypothetical protein [Mesorhizobium japonicum]|uniref:hypothetical protein n=1 Tax=Mesorhizobium japonicum TaxID=2066070 RepID=UPI003B5C37F0